MPGTKPKLKIGKYKTVFRGKIFKIQQATATFASGKKKTFERILRPPFVMVLAFDEKQRLLLTREYHHILKKTVWNLPSGRGDKGKIIQQEAQRELREETGFKAKRMKLFYTVPKSQTSVWKKCAFLADDLVHSPLGGDEDEQIKVVSMSVEKAYALVLNGKIENELIAFVLLKLYREWKHVKKWLKAKSSF